MYHVFYTNKFIADRFAAETYGPFIFIRPEKKGDVGLLEHEKVHVKQFWRTCGLFAIPYWLSAKARVKYEVEAYREQLKYSPGKEALFASYLATRYGAALSQNEALALLKD
jgi:hypothetical protein